MADMTFIDRKVSQIESHVAKLRARWPDVPRVRPAPPEPYDQMLEELSASVEELRILQEELQKSNDDLAHAYEAAALDKRRYQDLFDFAPDAYIVTDRHGKILEANETAVRRLNYPATMVISKPLRMFVSPEDRPRFSSLLLDATSRGQTLERELRLRVGADGPDLPCAVRVGVSQLGKNLVLRWIIRDLTEQKALEAQAAEAVLREQQRIGAEIHDGLGQQMAAIHILTNCLRGRIAAKLPDEEQIATELSAQVHEAWRQVRALARGLMPVQIEAGELHVALANLAASVEMLYSIRCEFECDAPPGLRDSTVANHLFRIAQEALHNAVRHADTKRVVIWLRRERDRLTLGVRDDGCGMPADSDLELGLGLRTMRYRAELLGADFKIAPAIGGGTEATCSVACHRPVGQVIA